MIGVSHAVVTTARQLQGQLGQLREVLEGRPDPDPALGTGLDDMEARLQQILDTMTGTDDDGGATQPGAPPLARQIRQLYSAIGASTALPTAEQTQLTERSRELLAGQVGAVNEVLDGNMVRLHELLDQAGIPWTPGRRVAPVRRVP